MDNKLDKYTNRTGGAYGVDTYGCILGIRHGFNNHIHFRPSDNTRLPPKLRAIGLEPAVISDAWLTEARNIVNEVLGTNYQDDIRGRLQCRNYFQVYPSDAVYCFSRKTGDSTISGGTNTTLQLAIKYGKEAYVYDIEGFQWYFYDSTSATLCELSEPPTLKYNYAIVGTRDIEDYKVKCKKTGKWIPRKQYIGADDSYKVISEIEGLYKRTLEKEVSNER